MERVWVQLELTNSARRLCKIASVLAPGASSPTLTDESGVFYFNFELQNNLKTCAYFVTKPNQRLFEAVVSQRSSHP